MAQLRLPSGPSLRARPPLVRPEPLPHAEPSAPALKDCKEYSTTVAVKIKLARFGKIREPFYRIVVADARTRRSGRAIENIGLYHPKADPSIIEVNSDRAQYWLSVGAQPTESVLSLLKVTGDWQKFKGLPGAEGTLRVAPAKTDKRSLYEAAMAQVTSDDGNSATTPKKKAAKAAPEAPAADAAPAAETAESTDAS
jgi:small subunit ribosomal protein S16